MVLALKRIRWWLIFLASLTPLFFVIYQVLFDQLGADPAQAIVLVTGIWALRFILITLAVTPVKKVHVNSVLSLKWIVSFRRMLGLFALFYTVLHLFAFLTFILGWRIDLISRELTQRPYIVVGLVSFLIMLPLGITSTKSWMKRLGKNWMRLHWLIYPASILAMLHYVMQVRAGYAEHLFYGSVLLLLLGYRIVVWFFRKNKQKIR